MTIRIDGTNSAANPGITGSDTDTGLQFGTDEVNIVTGGSTAVTVDSSQRVGIGAISPSTPLHVASSSGTQLTLARTGTTSDYSLEILRGARDSQGIFTDGTGISLRAEDATNGVTSIGLLGGNVDSNSIDRIQFNVNGSERLRITSNGTLRLSNSPGIDFSQIQTNAAGMTSETLDSYEEGTWTPDLQFGSANTGITYSTRNGFYSKIGKTVFIRGGFVLQNKGTATGLAQIAGLPFTIESRAYADCTGIGGTGTMPGGSGPPVLVGANNATRVTIWFNTTTNSSRDLADQNNFNNNTELYFSMVYEAD